MKFLKSSWTPFFLTVLLGAALNVEAARNLIGDMLFLRPASLPSAGKDGYLRVDSSDNKLKKYNESAGQWEEISGSGGGGGGGINLLVASNFDFEDSPSSVTPWTNTGSGTFTLETGANVGFGDQSGNCDAAASGDKCLSEAISVPNGLKGQSCLLEYYFRFDGGTDGHYSVRVEDGSGNALSASVDPTASSDWQRSQIFFTCPDSGNVQAVVESNDPTAASILIDQFYLGSNKNEYQLSQAELFGTATWTPVTNCIWSGNASTFTSYAADSDCNDPVTVGGVSAPDTKIPAIKIPVMEPGNYKITWKGVVYQNDGSNNSECQFRLGEVGVGRFGGPGTIIDFGSAQSGVYGNTLVGFMRVTDTKTNVVIDVQKRVSSGLANCNVRADSSNAEFFMTFDVEKFPLNPVSAVITEGAKPMYAVATYDDAGSSFDMGEDLANTNEGDIPISLGTSTLQLHEGNTITLQTMCDNEIASGETCAGTEIYGISIPGDQIKRNTTLRVCTHFGRSWRKETGQTQSSAGALVKINSYPDTVSGPQSDPAVTLAGRAHQNMAFAYEESERHTQYHSASICDTFEVNPGTRYNFALAQRRTGDASAFLNFQTIGNGAQWTVEEVGLPKNELVVYDFMPVGAVLPFAGSTAPSGFLSADGSCLAKVGTYRELFDVIGIAHGECDAGTGAGSGFNLPDYRGRFLRGVDDGQARDPDAGSRLAMSTGGNTGDNVGSVQADAFDSHTHSTTLRRNLTSENAANAASRFLYLRSTLDNPLDSTTQNFTSSAAGGSETRPINAYVNYIIKY